jgi:hypothetical protein
MVRNRPSARLNASSESERPFARPPIDTATFMAAYAHSRDSVNKLIFDSTRVLGLKTPWLSLGVHAAGGVAAHSFSDSTGRERRTGFMYGGMGEAQLFRYFRLTGEFRTGSLTSTGSAIGTELGVTEAGASLAVQTSEAFLFGGSWALRATREGPAAAPLAIQQWSIPKVFISVRPAFIGGYVRTQMGLNALLPFATYTGYLDNNDNQVNPEAFSLGGDAGLEFVTGGFRAGLLYNFESFRFPKVGTSERRDQFSTLRIRLGWQYAK